MSEIKETIKDVLAAEEQADAVIEDANRKSKEILLSASAEVSSIVSKNEAAIKSSVKDILAGGEAQAKEAYDEIVKRGVQEAEALKKGAQDKIEAVADYIVGKFQNAVKINYGNN